MRTRALVLEISQDELLAKSERRRILSALLQELSSLEAKLTQTTDKLKSIVHAQARNPDSPSESN